jgi:hypothetical protein
MDSTTEAAIGTGDDVFATGDKTERVFAWTTAV